MVVGFGLGCGDVLAGLTAFVNVRGQSRVLFIRCLEEAAVLNGTYPLKITNARSSARARSTLCQSMTRCPGW